jgi:hypothetical protein
MSLRSTGMTGRPALYSFGSAERSSQREKFLCDAAKEIHITLVRSSRSLFSRSVLQLLVTVVEFVSF